MKKILVITAISLLLIGQIAFKKPEVQPNVILFFIDDMGAMDLGCYGNVFNQTPNIDKIAQNGVRFSNASFKSRLDDRKTSR
jgi:hypothetical protein